MGGADRRGEAGFGAERIAAGDEGEIVRAAAQLLDEVGDQIVEPAGFADQADQRLAWDGFCGGEDSGFDAQHPFAPAGGGRQVGELDVEVFVSAPLPTAGRGGHRPYSRNVGRPENSRAAPSATSRSNSRRAARSVIGAWRAASAGETQSRPTAGRRFLTPVWRAAWARRRCRASARRRQVPGKIEGRGRGPRDRPGGGVCPSGVAGSRPRSTHLDFRLGSRILVAISCRTTSWSENPEFGA